MGISARVCTLVPGGKCQSSGGKERSLPGAWLQPTWSLGIKEHLGGGALTSPHSTHLDASRLTKELREKGGQFFLGLRSNLRWETSKGWVSPRHCHQGNLGDLNNLDSTTRLDNYTITTRGPLL